MIIQKEIHDLDLEPFEPEDIPLNIALKNYLLFTKKDDKTICVTCETHLYEAMNFKAKVASKLPVILVDQDSYEALYNKFLELKTDRQLANIQEESKEEQLEDDMSLTEFLRNASDILTSEESAPIIKFVNALFYQAIKKRASDIHIEMHDKKGIIRFRIDGILVKHVELDPKILTLVVSRIKVISNLDIAEKRIPQDGRTQITIAKKSLDVRVSVLPTYYGERVVMRILMESSHIPSMNKLGFNKEITKELNKLLLVSHGIIIVAGPTGSGKSTTLHSFLQKIASPEKNIITVEDPVEYKADNINQIQVNEKVGLTFASALRSILRQDPDIILVGEIRDPQTAKIATQAALTGHLVFSTLHTNNATAALARLSDMGVETFLISSSLLGILSQRLVRILCPHCKELDNMATNYEEDYGIDKNTKIYKAKGCPKCNHTGYIGRVAVGELLIMDDDIKELMKKTVNDFELRELAKQKGMVTISEKLIKMIQEGKTSLDEALRIGLKDT